MDHDDQAMMLELERVLGRLCALASVCLLPLAALGLVCACVGCEGCGGSQPLPVPVAMPDWRGVDLTARYEPSGLDATVGVDFDWYGGGRVTVDAALGDDTALVCLAHASLRVPVCRAVPMRPRVEAQGSGAGSGSGGGSGSGDDAHTDPQGSSGEGSGS